MNNLLLTILVSVFLLLMIYYFGPRVDLSEPVTTIELPEKLDNYFRESEAGFGDITENTEKIIIWADPQNKIKTKLSFVYIHGFSATRQEVSPLLEDIAAELKANLFLTRLTGHGRSSDAMANVTVKKLLQDAQEALMVGERLGDQVVLVGTSTGATLITWLLAKNSKNNIHSAILLSPNYGLKNPKSKLLLKPWAKYWLPIFEGETYRFSPKNDQQKKYWTWQYPTTALIPMMGLIKLVQSIPVEKIMTPMLMVYSKQDQVVDIKSSLVMYDRFKMPVKSLHSVDIVMDAQKHVLAGDILSPQTTKKVNTLMTQFLSAVP